MPELPNRNEIDEKLSALIALELEHQKHRMLSLLGDPPNPQRVPAGYWYQLASSMRTVLLHDLEQAFIAAANQHAGNLEHPLDTSELAAAAFNWALEHVDDLVNRFVQNTRDVAQQKIQEYHAAEEKRAAEVASLLLLLDDEFGTQRKAAEERAQRFGTKPDKTLTPQEHADRLNRLEEDRRDYQGRYIDAPFSAGRATGMAVNGHTAATTAGERHVNGGYTGRTGVKLVAIWVNDTRIGHTVCPVCRALEGLPEDQWPVEFQAGPPSPHPNCACSVRYEPAANWTGFQVSESQALALTEALVWSKSPAGLAHLMESACPWMHESTYRAA